MAPFFVFVVVAVLARIIGALGVGYVASWPAALAVGLAVMFFVTASAHFLQPRRAGLIAIVPPRFPAPSALVTATGVLETIGAIALLVPPTFIEWPRPAAAWCLAALMLAMFPANVYAARKPRHPSAPHTPLGRRVALQLVFVASAVVVAVFSVL